MANNPFNLALRFLLELAALACLAYWGWTQHTGLARVLLAIGAPLIAAAAWGAFRTPGTHGKGLVAVSGVVRLLVEAAVFGNAVWALVAAERPTWAAAFAIIVAFHYFASYDYVVMLLRPKGKTVIGKW